MSDLKDKVVLFNFWTTDCLVCLNEIPLLLNAYQPYKQKYFEIITVAMPYDPPTQVLNFATQKKLPFPMHDGLAEMTEKFSHVDLTPTTFIFNKQGKQLQRTIGTLDFIKLSQLLIAELVATN